MRSAPPSTTASPRRCAGAGHPACCGMAPIPGPPSHARWSGSKTNGSEVLEMGGRGASSGISDYGNPYGSQYHALMTSGNIKFVEKNGPGAETLMDTMTAVSSVLVPIRITFTRGTFTP